MAAPVVITPAADATSNSVATQTNNLSTAAGTNDTTATTTAATAGTATTAPVATDPATTPATTPAAAAPVPSGVKVSAKTDIVPNPLNNFATYTYNWSLWWLDIADYNGIMTGGGSTQKSDPAIARDFTLSPNSYVIAEDGGAYANRRLPSQQGLTYQIQEVELNTNLSWNAKTSGSNDINGKIKVIEPYGVTFIDTLVYWAIASTTSDTTYENYLSRPYMLQLDFVGYDDAGNPIPTDSSKLYRKRFPIRLLNIALDVGSSGAEYDITIAPYAHAALTTAHVNTPKAFTAHGGTVQEVFDDYKTQLNDYLKEQSSLNSIPWSDSYDFKFDPAIGQSTVTYARQMPLTQSNPNSATIDTSTSTFNIPGGMSILKVIERIMVQSDFLLKQVGQNLAAKGLTETDEAIQASLATTFNLYRVNVLATSEGADATGTSSPGAFDHVRNRWPTKFTYNIHQCPVVNATSPTLPFYPDPTPTIVKVYNYLYTGQNVDIINFKLHFDTTFYTTLLAYTTEQAATQSTSNTALDATLSNQGSILLTPQLVAQSGLLGGIGKTPNPQPLTIALINTDKTATQGFGIINNPGAQTMAMAVKSLYSSSVGAGSGVSATLTIVGDPTMLKQDDWLYSPDPTQSSDYTNWDMVSQAEYSKKYGHMRTDVGPLVFQLNINTPIDLDTEWFGSNQGLMTPPAGTYPSLFSGLYFATMIKNKFVKGEFTQEVTIQRILQSSMLQSPTFQQAQYTVRSASNSRISQLLDQLAAATPGSAEAAAIQQQIVQVDNSRK